MRGLMQDRPLTLPYVLHRAEQLFGHKTMVTGTVGGESTTTVAECAVRVRRLATALDALGVPADGRVATFCWNTAPHLELYLAAPCTGRVLHTLNIRLFPEQLVYIANHAEDDVVFVDRSLLPVFWPLRDKLTTVRHVVVIDDGAEHPLPDGVLNYDELLAANAPFDGRFAVDDEHRAAAMCYTSGTTGHPKGVVYSHRSTLLHTLITLTADFLALSEPDVVLPVVPMFHANAWGMPYGALLAGSSLVFPGPNMTPPEILAMVARHRVTVTAGVPTIWMGARPHLDAFDLSSLRTILCGGSAAPRSLSEAYRAALGLPLLHGWGMTETSPDATVSPARSQYDDADEDTRAAARARQGWPHPLVELRLADPATGELLPWDDTTTGELQAAGPFIAAEYYRGEGGGVQFTADGWLRTGDGGHRGPLRLGAAGGPHEGPGEVRRGVDQLGRAGERDHVPPEGGGGGRDRRAAQALDRTAAGLCGRRAGRDPDRGGGARSPRAARAEVVAARRRRVYRRGAQDQRRQVLQEDPARQIRRLQLTDPAESAQA